MKVKQFLIFLFCALLSTSVFAWDLWDEFKAVNVTEEGRVVDYSDTKLITTSEGQSYGMFFALVANDRQSFDKILQWSEKNLGEDQPAWLWGIPDGKKDGQGKILDTNNATDADMWIAYSLLEAARIWHEPKYMSLANKYLAKLKEMVRDIPTIGKVILPGRVGFEDKGIITLNPSYYPPHILRRFAEHDSYWLPVLEGSINAMIRSAPTGVAPDWSKFNAEGVLIDENKMIGSYNAIRTYLWASILSPKDQNYQVLAKLYAPMIGIVRQTNIPPEEVNISDMTVSTRDVNAFGACFLPYLSNEKSGGIIRTVLTASKMKGDNYYRNVLTLFGLGFDYKHYAFNEKGELFFPKVELMVQGDTPKANE